MKDTRELLREYLQFDIDKKVLKEAVDSGGPLIVSGILQKSDTLNQNGRIYPRKILEREVSNYQRYIAENRSLGECDHPDSSVIELKNSSHIVRKAWMEGDIVRGEVEILNTPSGLILKSLIAAGVTLGISSRGLGSTKKEGDRQIVQEDFQLICWDFVSEPSTPGAFMMKESIDGQHTIYENIKSSEKNNIKKIISDILGNKKNEKK